MDNVPNCMAPLNEFDFNSSSNDTQSDGLNVDYILHGIVVTILFGLGTVGNSLTIFVFTRPRHWPCINYYLVVLALWDIALLLGAFLLFATPTLLYGSMPLVGAYVQIYPYLYVFSNLTLIGSLWIVVMLTVERFLAIYRPLQHRTFMNNHARVKSILLIVSIAAVAYNIPRLFDLKIANCVDDDGILRPKIDQTWLYKDWWYRTFYKVVGNLLFVYAGPFLVLSILTFFICIEIRRAATSNQLVVKVPVTNSPSVSSTNPLLKKSQVSLRRTVLVLGKHQTTKELLCSRQQSTNVNIMSMIVVSKFLCCYSLPTVLDICELMMSEENFDNLGVLVSLANVFVVFNSSCNFLIYFTFGKSFRECLLGCVRKLLEKIFKREFHFGGGSSAEEQNSQITVSFASSLRRRSSGSPNNVNKQNSYASIEAVTNNKLKNVSNKDLWV